MEKININKGDILGFETDTVWGLGCLPNDKRAVEKIYEIKGRDRSKPLILMSDSLENLLPYVKNIPDYAKKLMESYFPGGLTLIFEKTKLVPEFICSNKNSIGIRVPNHKGFQDICKKIEGRVLATTSLNFSGENPVTSWFEACEKFGTKVRIFKPENPLQKGVSSTVVLCVGNKPQILRKGDIEIHQK